MMAEWRTGLHACLLCSNDLIRFATSPFITTGGRVVFRITYLEFQWLVYVLLLLLKQLVLGGF